MECNNFDIFYQANANKYSNISLDFIIPYLNKIIFKKQIMYQKLQKEQQVTCKDQNSQNAGNREI